MLPHHAPFRFVVSRLELAATDLSITFEVSISSRYEHKKGDTKCRKWGSRGLPKVTGNITI